MQVIARLDDFAAAAGAETEELSFSCDSGELLRVFEFALEQQYENIFSTIAQFRVAGAMRDVIALAIRRRGQVAAVFLFRIERNKAIVLNEAIHIDHDSLERAAAHIFKMYKSVAVISWHAIQTDVERLPFPFQRFNYSEDIVVRLPPSEQDYLAMLGKATRKNLIRHRNRLKRDYPSLGHRVYAGQEIQESHIRQIVAFNCARMAGKHKKSGFHDEEVQRLITLATTHGVVSVVTIDGRICAGSICHRVGHNYFMEVSAHDPQFDEYRLGTLSCYLAICTAIRLKGTELHLLWGRDEYKYLLHGEQRDLDNVLVYRSRLHMLRNGWFALETAFHGLRRRVKLVVNSSGATGAIGARLLKSGIDLARGAKRLAMGRA
jgi:CelD/BcsL family acetyltransferase involved in cellulose biosynthesis